jgi:hypothetical protein
VTQAKPCPSNDSDSDHVETAAVVRSVETLVACPNCDGPVNASLEVDRGILDVLMRLALADAWDGVEAPALDATLTRLVQDYEERIRMRITREPLDQRLVTPPALDLRHEGARTGKRRPRT